MPNKNKAKGNNAERECASIFTSFFGGSWYVAGYAPVEPEKTYAEKRLSEYPAISEQLDMIYWDKVNGTNLWQEKIAEIKAKYPKDEDAA